ncbi:HD-GYP domain-containing protein [Peribacillus kribbensis]|uniref:HD-GYP domain-containing protein n=1 Tax=Peribacillus kribbensis TaxID=356658 RepID=UPI000427694E|nr:HD-GYP domain-containing protein [Peribacillus kribbensis]
MRLMSTELLKPGIVLGRSIYNERGKALLNEGVTLTDRHIIRLKELNIPFVHIFDPLTSHIKVVETVSAELRRKAVSSIYSAFRELQEEPQMSTTVVLEKTTRHFKGLVSELVQELHKHQDLVQLLTDVYTYDSYIFTHSLNVTLYTIAVGIKLKLTRCKLETLALGALLHDVGKLAVPLDILLKPGRLTEEEFSEIKNHAENGFKMLKDISSIPIIAAHCAYQHHERLDGSGYPRGLKGEDIHHFGKIIAVADVFDAVTSNRSYRSAMLPHEGLEILYAGAGTQFDRDIVKAFRKSVAIYPNSLVVRLNDGRKAVVSRQNHDVSDRPVVEIFEEEGKLLESTYEVDLEAQLDVIITGCDTGSFVLQA